MKSKKLIVPMASLLVVAALAGCKPPSNKITIDFWTGFGNRINAVMNPLLTRFQEENPDIVVKYDTKEGYPNLQQAINGSVSTSTFPHIANGYPDHLATYLNQNILLNLNNDRFINNPEFGVDVNEYYADYMKENTGLVDGRTYGIPFNKSTEVMVVNHSLFEAAKKIDATIEIPATWQDLEVVGPKLRAVVQNWLGKLVTKEGVAVDKPAEKPTQEFIDTIAVDMTTVKTMDDFMPFSYDSNANFFISALKQWGAEYTAKGETFQTGKILFHTEPNRSKAVTMLTKLKQLYDAKTLSVASAITGAGLYSSGPFKEGRIALTVSSSAGVTENVPTATDYPFQVAVHPVLYNADFPENKYVISQGTNLALFSRGKATDEKAQKERLAAWKLLKFLTYEHNHEFGMKTSYFPVTDGTKLAVDETNVRYQDYKMYSEFLAKTDGTRQEVATRDTAKLQANVYQAAEENWNKFVDPGFIGSSRIRTESENLLTILFGGMTPEQAIDDIANKLKDFK